MSSFDPYSAPSTSIVRAYRSVDQYSGQIAALEQQLAMLRDRVAAAESDRDLWCEKCAEATAERDEWCDRCRDATVERDTAQIEARKLRAENARLGATLEVTKALASGRIR